jgi:hypothetical protein
VYKVTRGIDAISLNLSSPSIGTSEPLASPSRVFSKGRQDCADAHGIIFSRAQGLTPPFNGLTRT